MNTILYLVATLIEHYDGIPTTAHSLYMQILRTLRRRAGRNSRMHGKRHCQI